MNKGNEYLIIKLQGYEKQLEMELKELSKMPEGTLVFTNSRGRTNYVQLLPASGQTGGQRVRRTINKNPYLVRQLARKKYLQSSVKMLAEEIGRTKNFLQSSRPPNADEVLKLLPDSYKKLPQGIFFPERETARKWAETDYVQSDFRPHEKIHSTIGGIKVRTKSELLVADRLEIYELPIRYEEEIGYRQYSFSPDFSILTKEGIKYWEHCGMMADPNYRRRNEWKLQIYNKMGIVPWKNLIITYDDEDGGVDLRIIESEIVNKLLPIKI